MSFAIPSLATLREARGREVVPAVSFPAAGKRDPAMKVLNGGQGAEGQAPSSEGSF